MDKKLPTRRSTYRNAWPSHRVSIAAQMNSADAAAQQFCLAVGIQRNSSDLDMLDPANELYSIAAPDIILDLRPFSSMEDHATYRDGVRAINPNCIIGAYWRSCLHSTETPTIPPAMLTSAQIELAWDTGVLWPDETDRWFVNMTIPAARAASIAVAIANAQACGANAVCFDTCYWDITVSAELMAVVSKTNWTAAYMSFYAEAFAACHAVGLKVIYNVATQTDKTAEAFALIEPYADGLGNEGGFYDRSTAAVAAELAGYEAVLKKGKKVIVIPYAADVGDRVPAEDFALQQIASLARTHRNIYATCAGVPHANANYFITV